jgi:hypothetical protein
VYNFNTKIQGNSIAYRLIKKDNYFYIKIIIFIQQKLDILIDFKFLDIVFIITYKKYELYKKIYNYLKLGTFCLYKYENSLL